MADASDRDPQRQAHDSVENPVYEPVLADPAIIRARDGTYYAFGTEDASPDWDDCAETAPVPIVASEGLVDWTYVGNAFEERPDWKDEGFVWAPDIAHHDGRYYLYYALSEWGDENPGIGVATSDTPTGPYRDHGKLFDSDEIGVPNSIDPHFFVDDGTPYLTWGSFNGIYLLELTNDGLGYRPETKTKIAGEAYEAPWIVKRDGEYVLFLSTGLCCEGLDSTYAVEVATADALTGPYRNGDGTDVREFDEHNAGIATLAGNDEFVGPGHNALVTDDTGTDWLAYHAYDAAVGGYVCERFPRRALALDRIEYDGPHPDVADGALNRTIERPVVYRTGGAGGAFDLASWHDEYGVTPGDGPAYVFRPGAIRSSGTVEATLAAPPSDGSAGIALGPDLNDGTAALALEVEEDTATLRVSQAEQTTSMSLADRSPELRLTVDDRVTATVRRPGREWELVGTTALDTDGPLDAGMIARGSAVRFTAFTADSPDESA